MRGCDSHVITDKEMTEGGLNMDELDNHLRYGFGEHLKGEAIKLCNKRLIKKVSLDWEYYDGQYKKCSVIKDENGKVVNKIEW